MVYKRIRVSSALSKTGLYDLDYAYNPYAGCHHGCRYCYGRAYTRYREVAEAWGEIVYVKENVVEVLMEDVLRARRGVVGVSTITDPYQPIEAKERLTRRGLEILLDLGFEASIQTKSPLVLRDLDLLSRYRDKVDVGLTITTLSPEVAAVIEPRAPEPGSRAEALRKLSAEGLSTWIFLGPIMRGVNDSPEVIEGIVALASETGSKLYYDFFRMKRGLTAAMSAVKERYPNAMSSEREWRMRVAATVEKLCERESVRCEPAFPARERGKGLLEHI
ncbi:MAG: radical SAM protein [Nitrososphaerota archaeon]